MGIVKPVIVASISVAIVSLILLGGIFNPFDTISGNDQDVQPAGDNIVVPTETTVTPENYMLSPETFVIKPDTTVTTVTTTSGKFLVPLAKHAFAITPTQNSVTFKTWDVPSAFSQPVHLAVNSTGHVYFTEFHEVNGNKIGALNPSTDVINEWDIPTPSSFPRGIAVNSTGDGNVYFVEEGGNKIGRLVPSTGVITEWTVPTASSGPFGITIDFNGNVYFAVRSGGAIGKLVPSTGVVSVWQSPTFEREVRAFSLDPLSGNVYFAGADSSFLVKIHRLVPSTNVITAWDALTSNIHGSIEDSSGNVYFSDTSVSRITRLVPSTNVMTEWFLPSGSSPFRVVVDSNDNVYFTEFNVYKIGRLS